MKNMQKNNNTIIKGEKGITGLETAIILIAFVIVASVLSYVVISAGLFSSQKAKAAVNSGLAQSGSTIELKGNVTAEIDKATGVVTKIYFTIGVVPGGNSIDLIDNPVGGTAKNNKLTITYSDTEQQLASLYWTADYINSNNSDKMLDPGEIALITIDSAKANYTTAPNVMAKDIVAGSNFFLGVTPQDGAVLPIERKIPSGISFAQGATGTAMINLY
jgi:archaeal flagellin FlaB